MRAIWQERNEVAKSGVAVGPTTLFFGCRDADSWLYRSEVESLRPLKVECHVGFSRQGQDKQYVQDVVEKHIAAIMTALDSSNAYIYICGKIDMAQAVQTILKRDRGVAWWDEIIATRRYNQEVFG
ncbi:hypothetical protein DYB26_015306 [Aphanomyces astaci]|uniref:NADPH--hemoprotein reductase n=1 Tax=Aphanomyces astaci TaxID=112090 RepID=A0A3R7BRS1_APHAT|nr:hypothetical protein DYB26_015306 [Aphanomyces astaci]